MPDDPESQEGKENKAIGLGCFSASLLYLFLGGYAFSITKDDRMPLFFWYAPWTVALVPVVLAGLLYLALRRRFPAFARGLRFVLQVCCVILLGLYFIYMGMLVLSSV